VAPQDIATFAREADADILVLAENTTPAADLLRALNAGVLRRYFPDDGFSNRLSIFTRFRAGPMTLVRDSPGVAIRHYSLPLGESLLLVAVHLPSKLRRKTEEQILASTRIAGFVRKAEDQVQHSRTVVMGDLNMNPFEIGVVGSEGFHAIMDRRIAASGSRTVNEEERLFFYNPMWGALGDDDESRPPGTYFRNTGGEVNYYWNVFDQVLLRPSLLRFMETQPVRVITELGGASLLTNSGRPNRKVMSGHLPIVCRLHEFMFMEHADAG
jgi:hypothetical protein